MKSEKFSLNEILKLERRPIKIEPEKYYQEIGIYSHGKGIFHKEPRTGFEVGNKKLFMIKEGDFIFQITFAWEGAIALAGPAEDGLYASVRFPTFRINKSICDPKYLLYYFKTSDGLYQIGKISPGSAGRNRVLSLKKLPEVKIPLPPLEEQRRIVARIESLTNRIEEARRLRAEAVEEGEKMFQSELGRLIESASGEKKKLKEIFKIKSGKGLNRHERNENGKHKVYGSNGIVGFHSEYIIKDPTIIIGRKGSTGKLTLTDGPSWPIDTTYYTIPLINLDLKYLYYLLLEKRLDELPTRSPKPGISSKDIYPIVVNFVENIETQRRIVAYLDSLQAKVDELKRLQAETEKEMEELIPSILDKAFKGEL